MRARAESAAATRARILEAATAAMRRQFRPEVRLDAVAAEAGVTVQTVLRIFGSKRQLLDEVTEIAARDVAVHAREQLQVVPPAEIPAAGRRGVRRVGGELPEVLTAAGPALEARKSLQLQTLDDETARQMTLDLFDLWQPSEIEAQS